MKCSKENCDQHSTFYQTILDSHQWKKWYKEQHKRVKELCEDGAYEKFIFDIDGCQETGQISQRHFQEFLKWIKENNI